ncbi:MAG: hypothetical protein NT116_04440 [Candidatus Parcubacteria bacterium]|nr:hypothetical protein [Candidatus Parcubacteria bacterium]
MSEKKKTWWVERVLGNTAVLLFLNKHNFEPKDVKIIAVHFPDLQDEKELVSCTFYDIFYRIER